MCNQGRINTEARIFKDESFLLNPSEDRRRWRQWLCKFENVDEGNDAYEQSGVLL